jgi:hypothetical protein
MVLIYLGIGRVLATELGMGVEVAVRDGLLERQAIRGRRGVGGRSFGGQMDGGVGMAVAVSIAISSSC